MSTELHVLAGEALRETFRLAPGAHLLGSSDSADLLLSTRDAASDICEVELSPEGEVTLTALGDDVLRRWDGETGFRITLRSGDLCEVGRLRLILLRHAPPRRPQAEEVPDLPLTAPSPGVRPPVHQNLALKIREGSQTRVILLERPTVTLGRAPGAPPAQTVLFSHPEVSRQHARVVTMPDGLLWIEDLGNTNGTFLNGSKLAPKASWPVGGRVRLSPAFDAPEIELIPAADALLEEGEGRHLSPLRGTSKAMREVRAQILRYAPSNDPLLIRGETGCGKELVATALAALHHPKHAALHPVDCARFQETLIEAELFGYCKGAFTGATQEKKGLCEAAGKDTIFFDEIGELPLAFQPKLLRALESKTIRRLGETDTRPIEARVLAATHRDLAKMVEAGGFREDLYFRLAVLEIVLPPLRHRLEDLPDLAQFFLRSKMEARGERKSLSEEALRKLLAYGWPGNVRQLKHVIERAFWDSDDSPEILAAHIQLPTDTAETAPPVHKAAYPALTENTERDYCEWALTESEGNVAAAARLVGMSQSAYRRWLVRHDLLPAPRGGTGKGA